MDALARLLDTEAIKLVKARYCRLLDTKDWDGLAALFTDDAVMDVEQDTGNPPMTGVAAIIDQIRFAVDHAATSHQVHSPEITLTDADAATGLWAMQDRVVWQPGTSPVPGVGSITGYGQYHERYRREGGDWKIAALKLTRFHVDMHAD
ncbi:nuclear transport factor 2 family protein [Blastomonas fulva]|uniref:nuclear transport factor 2 family protein n=1 Tax=Blastomonas fulva TaxID=1550728 RepID=UPI003F71DA05